MSVPVKQPIPINFSGSLDTKTDPWQVGPAAFLVLNNMNFSVPAGGGGARLNKRNGFPSFGKTINTPSPALTYSNVGGTLTAARKIFSYNDELLLNDAFNLYSYDHANDAWNYKGRSTTVALSTANIAQGNSTYITADCSIDTTTGIKVFAYYNFALAEVIYSIQDASTGQFLVNQSMFGGSTGYTHPRCVSISGKSWIFAIKISDGKIYYQAIVGQTVTGSVTALITNLNATKQFFDVDVDAFSGNMYIVYHTSTPSITISALSTSMVVGNSITKVESATHGVSWFGDGTNIWVVYNNGTATKAFIVNNAVSATTAAPTTIESSAASATVNNVTGVWSTVQSKAFIFYDQMTITSGSLTAADIYFNSATLSGSTITPSSPILAIGSVSLNSKAFTVSGIPHIVAHYAYTSRIPVGGVFGLEAIQATNFLLNIYNLTPTMGASSNNDVVANIAAKISPDGASTAPTPGSIGDPGTPGGSLSGIHQNSSGAWDMALLQNSNFAFEVQPYSPFFSPTGVIDCQFDFSLSNPDAQSLGNNAQIAGGQVTMYDGANVVEQNFHIYPNSILWSSIATTGGAMGLASSDAVYSYIFVYEWIDNQGQVHRSFPSPVITPLSMSQDYTFASGEDTGTVTLSVPMLRVTNKGGSQVVVNIYRTVANGSVYFLLGDGLSGNYGTVLNDPSIDTKTYVDSFGDFQISGNLQLYTTGALGYYAPPASSALTNFKNRAVQIGYENPFQFGYSNAVLQNFPVQFVPFFLQNIGSVGGGLVAIAQMDDKMVILKSGKIEGPAIYYMQGQGPAPSGAGNDFQDPLPIATDVGCVDRPSVVLMPDGIMFKSNKGIYLLDRGLNASYIGAPVEAYNQYSVVSAKLIPNTTQVRFLLSGAPVGMLMYDYFYKKWSTYTTPPGVSDCIFQGQHTYVASDGTVYKESPGTYYDGVSTPVLQNFTISWIKLAGLQGYQRSYFYYLLAQYISSHQLSVSTYTNFSEIADQTNVITPDSTKTLENWRGFFQKQRCQSFKISVQEVYTGVLGAGFTMSGINLIAGVKGPFRTIPADQSVG